MQDYLKAGKRSWKIFFGGDGYYKPVTDFAMFKGHLGEYNASYNLLGGNGKKPPLTPEEYILANAGANSFDKKSLVKGATGYLAGKAGQAIAGLGGRASMYLVHKAGHGLYEYMDSDIQAKKQTEAYYGVYKNTRDDIDNLIRLGNDPSLPLKQRNGQLMALMQQLQAEFDVKTTYQNLNVFGPNAANPAIYDALEAGITRCQQVIDNNKQQGGVKSVKAAKEDSFLFMIPALSSIELDYEPFFKHLSPESQHTLGSNQETFIKKMGDVITGKTTLTEALYQSIGLAMVQSVQEKTAPNQEIKVSDLMVQHAIKMLKKAVRDTQEQRAFRKKSTPELRDLLRSWGVSDRDSARISASDLKTLETMRQNYVAQYHHQKLKQNLDNANQLFVFAGQIGHALGIKEMQKAPMLGNAITKLVESMSALGALPSQAGLLAYLQPIGMGVMAFSALLSVFKKKKAGDDSMRAVMKQLQTLLQYTAEFRQEVMEQFVISHIYERMIYEAICEGFGLTYHMIKAETGDFRMATISRLDEIQSHLGYIEGQLHSGFKDITLDPLQQVLGKIEGKYRSYQKDQRFKLPNAKFDEYTEQLASWLQDKPTILAKCRHVFLTGAIYQGDFDSPDHMKRVLKVLSVKDFKPAQNLGFLLAYAKQLLPQIQGALLHHKAPINVDLWHHAVNGYVKLQTLRAVAGIEHFEKEAEIDYIAEVGEKTIQLLGEISKQAPSLFDKLLSGYKDRLLVLETAFKQEVLRLLKQDEALLGNKASILPLQGIQVDVHGAMLDLSKATVEPDLIIPPELVMAHHLGLGRFEYDGSKSSRENGLTIRHSNKRRGVSGRWPLVTYDILVYFCFEDIKVPIAQARHAYRSISDQDGNFKDNANGKEAEWQASISAWQAKPDKEYYFVLWRPEQLRFKQVDVNSLKVDVQASYQSDLQALLDRLRPGMIDRYIQQMHLRSPDSEVLIEIIKRDSIQYAIGQLNLQQLLIRAYSQLLGLPAALLEHRDEAFNDPQEERKTPFAALMEEDNVEDRLELTPVEQNDNLFMSETLTSEKLINQLILSLTPLESDQPGHLPKFSWRGLFEFFELELAKNYDLLARNSSIQSLNSPLVPTIMESLVRLHHLVVTESELEIWPQNQDGVSAKILVDNTKNAGLSQFGLFAQPLVAATIGTAVVVGIGLNRLCQEEDSYLECIQNQCVLL